MKREVIQELLNLNGIEAVSLCTRKMRPVFHGLNQHLDDRQKLAVALGVLQVLENMFEGFDQFEFYFLNHTVFIYKQTSGLVLLVIGSQDLELKLYQSVISKFRHILEQDIYSGVTLFKQISENTTQPGKIIANNLDISSRQLVSASLVESSAITAVAVKSEIKAQIKPRQIPGQPAQKIAIQKVSVELQTLISQLNLVSEVAAQYLGKTIASNYWKSTRSSGWLEQFEIDRQAQITHPNPDQSCSQAELEDLKQWAIAFILQSKKVLRNFDQILAEKAKDFLSNDLIKQILASDRLK